MNLWQRFRCWINWHPHLDVIQSFGSAQHIGCPDCGRHFGIHHGLRTVVPWDATFDELYSFMGYDTKRATDIWRKARALSRHDRDSET